MSLQNKILTNINLVDLKSQPAYLNSYGNIECLCSSPRSNGNKNLGIHTFLYIGLDKYDRKVWQCNDCYTVYFIKKTKAQKRKEFKEKQKLNKN